MLPDGDRNSPPAAVCIGTSAAPRDAVGTAAVGAVVAARAPTADDVPGPHADSASPMPRPSTDMTATLVAGVSCRKFIIIPLLSRCIRRNRGRRTGTFGCALHRGPRRAGREGVVRGRDRAGLVTSVPATTCEDGPASCEFSRLRRVFLVPRGRAAIASGLSNVTEQ